MKKYTGSLVSTAAIFVLLASSAVFSQQAETIDNEYQVGAILFQQKAAEYRALALQAFNIARIQFDADFEKKNLKKIAKAERKKPRAIVIDVDETALDNSPYMAALIRTRGDFSIESFFEWKKLGRAKPVPGAVEFLNYAGQKGADIFYVSNVPNSFLEVTVGNLRDAGFPDAVAEHVLLVTDSSSKAPRRAKIAETHRIVLLIGDNLNDLSEAFEGKSTDERFAAVDSAKDLWGTRFIVIPNIMYGAWENAIYGNKRATDAEKIEMRANALETN